MDQSYPSFTIVINTLNRGAVLQKTLESFQWLKYDGEFEVVVVNGPSTDNSEEVIASWLPRIRAGKCDVANLSVSRNVGICMARGDIIAFIDDDAVPEPEWLQQLAEAYRRDPQVGAVGGFVFNHTGYHFQYKYGLVDRFGNADLTPSRAHPQLSFPKSSSFPHLLGCNSSFLRSALLEIGGFDEEFEYFLDETDVCLRIVDAGYLIGQLPNAFVHHKYAPSNIRGENKAVRYRYPIIKNKIYFMLKHAREYYSLDRVMQEQDSFLQSQRNDVNWCHGERLLSDEDVKRFNVDMERAVEVGLQRGFEGTLPDGLITPAKQQKYAGEFLPFEPIHNPNAKCLVLVSKDFPPGHGGGIAVFSQNLAEALAQEGHIVHVITHSPDIDRVDLEHGVWVHRIVLKDRERTPEAVSRQVPQHIWNWSASALAEARRIAEHRNIDVIEAPIWDCEGIAFLLDGAWPLVTSLHTTLHFWIASHPEKSADSKWMESFGTPMLSLERELMLKADAVRANSKAIVEEIQKAYGFDFPVQSTRVVPHGMADVAVSAVEDSDHRGDAVNVLYVGRLEPRKGIDVLLEAIPVVMEACPSVRFTLVGDDTLPGPDGSTYKKAFLKRHSRQAWLSSITFAGRLEQEALLQAYAQADVFVAPSRFESFGLVFLEAMRVGKPVIGCRAGGMPEVVEDGSNGLLAEPGDVQSLAQAIIKLVDSADLRDQMGRAGLQRFQEHFTARRMSEKSGELYEIATAAHRERANSL
ncbi:glycosyltransferase [Bordetella tumbae]|uniref:glycosyltransferase n=1 Tax=Bordetella tumbae TaxID=1649139 RepID=UPI0039F01F33